MRDNFLIILLTISGPCTLLSQTHDNNIIQTVVDYSNRRFNVLVDFDHPFDTITYLEIPEITLNMEDGNVCMSDSSGNLMFYSNGLEIFDRTHKLMENGDNLNITDSLSNWFFLEPYKANEGYYVGSSHSNPIPLPGQSHQYLIIHHPSFLRNDFVYSKTYYSRIDMTLNNGLGAVIEKNVELPPISKEVEFCKHANGVDWWMIAADTRSNLYYIFLINEEGILGPQIQAIGSTPDPSNIESDWIFDYHKLSLSPSGNLLASAHHYDLDLFHFDRCIGSLEFIHNYKIPYNPGGIVWPNSTKIGNVAFSSDEIYGYVQNQFVIHQFEIENPNKNILRLAMTYSKQPNMRQLKSGEILIYSSYKEQQGSPLIGLISNTDQPILNTKVNYTIFDNYPAFSPHIINGNIPFFPNYKLGKTIDYNEVDCTNPFFNQELNPSETFNYAGQQYNKLYRTFID